MRELRTMFHRTGDKTPPWGVPARIQMMRATPLRLSLSFLGVIKCSIQLLMLPLALVLYRFTLDLVPTDVLATWVGAPLFFSLLVYYLIRIQFKFISP